MSHVTTLQELEAAKKKLVEWRMSLVEWYNQVNREFDREALRLGREINKLQKAEQPTTTKPKRHREPHFDGLDEDEIKHYKQLLKKGSP